MIRQTLIALAILGAFACAPVAQNDDDVRSGVTELVQRWSDAGEALDWDAVADTYADVESFVWIEQGEARYTSRGAILDGLDRARSMSASIRNDVSDIVVTPLSDDAAAFRAHYLLTVSAEGFSVNSEGVLSGVAIREGGTWRFLQGSFSEQPHEIRGQP
ncbi:MAG: nuclear transport factor 2 family protein [Hyphomonadaceae bacterium]|nr:nuclear transport factor 2 family protein [Hyphomonadaceae bacterium]